MTKALIIIPEELDTKIKIYQAKKKISIKAIAIINMLDDFIKTDTGKKLIS